MEIAFGGRSRRSHIPERVAEPIRAVLARRRQLDLYGPTFNTVHIPADGGETGGPVATGYDVC